MKEKLKEAILIAAWAHAAVKDKGGQPYLFHPLRVAQRLETDEEKIVAVLHDVIEDTEITALQLLEMGFPGHLVDAVLSVTKIKGETYEDFIKRVSWNPIGKKVKLADIEDNTDETRLHYLPEECQTRLKDKYSKAKSFLLDN